MGHLEVRCALLVHLNSVGCSAIRKRIAAQQAEQPVASDNDQELALPEIIEWLDDADEGSDLPGGWKQSYP